MRVVVLCLVVLVVCAGPVFSIPVSFEFTDSPSDYHFSRDSLTLEVSAGSASVTETIRGLGVDAGGSDSGTLDGIGADEALWFAFSETVRLLDVAFYWVDDNEEFALSLGNADLFGNPESIVQVGSLGGFFDFTGDELSSAIFGIKAGDGNSFRVTAMTVDYTPVPTPEPSTWLLLSLGVGGLAYWRQRQ